MRPDYRALFTADVHAGNSLPWAVKDPNTLITDRLVDIIDVLKQMSCYALENSINDIWILGDLIDKRLVDAVTLKLVTEELYALRKHGLNIYIVPGNHEAGDAACRHFTVDAFSHMGVQVAGLGETPATCYEPVDGFEIVALPYMPPMRAEKIISDHMGHTPNLMLIHQTIKGGMVGGWTSPDGLDPAMLEQHAGEVLSGHFHTPQNITERTRFLGAPVQHTFGDSGEDRGYWDITWSGKDTTYNLIPVRNAPCFHELEWKCGAQPPNLGQLGGLSYVNVKIIGNPNAVDKFWVTAQAWGASQMLEHGHRLVKLMRPSAVATGRKRLAMGDDNGSFTMDKILGQYLDQADCTGLNRQKLEQLGLELLRDVAH